MKLTMVASALVALALLDARSTSGQGVKASCLKEVGKSFAKQQVPSDVVSLVAAMRKTEPNFLDFSAPANSSEAYRPHPQGCTAIWETNESAIDLHLCFAGTNYDKRFFVDLAAADPSGRLGVEAYIACKLNKQFIAFEEERSTCMIEVGKLLAKHQVPSDVESLAAELRKNSRQDYIDFVPIEMPTGCREMKRLAYRLVEETCFQSSYGFGFLFDVARANRGSRPLVGGIHACWTNERISAERAAGKSPDGAE